MSEPINDGGPAFPVLDLSKTQWSGLALRDWFAGQALAGFNAQPDSGFRFHRKKAESMYAQADAMIEARSKRATT